MKVVIDTSVIIDNLRGGNWWDKFLRNADKQTSLYIPTIVLFELFSGASTKRRDITQKILSFTRYFEKIELTQTIAVQAGKLYRDSVKGLEVPDYITAASALEIGAQIATLNRKHFLPIPGLQLYTNTAA